MDLQASKTEGSLRSHLGWRPDLPDDFMQSRLNQGLGLRLVGLDRKPPLSLDLA